MRERKSRCTACGRKMDISYDEQTGKPYPIQFCGSKECFSKLWKRVQAAAHPSKHKEIAEYEKKLAEEPEIKLPRINEEQKEAILEQYRAGLQKKDIAVTLGCSMNRVYYVIQKYGGKL